MTLTKKYPYLLILGVILFTGFISGSLLSYHSARDSLAREIEESTLPLTGNNIYSEIQQDLLRPIFISSLMAHDTFLRDWVLVGEQDRQAITRFLKEIQLRHDTESAFFVSEKTRHYYHPQGMLKTVDHADPLDSWYFNFKQQVDDYEINIDQDTADPKRISVFINYKVFDYAGDFIGATGVGLSTSMVKQLIEDYQRRYNREIFFVDKLGNVTMHSDSYTGADKIREDSELGLYATRILTSPSTQFSYSSDGDTVYVNSRLIPEFNWYLVVQQRINPTADKIFQTLVLNLAGSLLITLVVLTLAWITISRFQSRLETMAHTDKLTGLANRQVLDHMLPQQVAMAQRRKEALSCIIADLDGFKSINDTYGHPTGDLLLTSIAHLFKARARASDLICRWGGDEFLLVLPNTAHAEAAHLAEELRRSVEQHHLKIDDRLVGVSLSLGIAELHAGESIEQLIARADKALLKAKQTGRNRIIGGAGAGAEPTNA